MNNNNLFKSISFGKTHSATSSQGPAQSFEDIYRAVLTALEHSTPTENAKKGVLLNGLNKLLARADGAKRSARAGLRDRIITLTAQIAAHSPNMEPDLRPILEKLPAGSVKTFLARVQIMRQEASGNDQLGQALPPAYLSDPSTALQPQAHSAFSRQTAQPLAAPVPTAPLPGRATTGVQVRRRPLPATYRENLAYREGRATGAQVTAPQGPVSFVDTTAPVYHGDWGRESSNQQTAQFQRTAYAAQPQTLYTGEQTVQFQQPAYAPEAQAQHISYQTVQHQEPAYGAQAQAQYMSYQAVQHQESAYGAQAQYMSYQAVQHQESAYGAQAHRYAGESQMQPMSDPAVQDQAHRYAGESQMQPMSDPAGQDQEHRSGAHSQLQPMSYPAVAALREDAGADVPVSPVDREQTPVGDATRYSQYSEKERADAKRVSANAGDLLNEIKYTGGGPLSQAAWEVAHKMNPELRSEDDLNDFVGHAAAVVLNENDPNIVGVLKLESALEDRSERAASRAPQTQGRRPHLRDYRIQQRDESATAAPTSVEPTLATRELEKLGNPGLAPEEHMKIAVHELSMALLRLREGSNATAERPIIQKAASFIVSERDGESAQGESAQSDMTSVKRAVFELQKNGRIGKEMPKSLLGRLKEAPEAVAELFEAPEQHLG